MELKAYLTKMGWQDLDSSTMEKALTHSSYRHERGGEDNETLEFLGDAVLSLIIINYLFNNHVEFGEGKLAKIKSHVVSEPVLAEVTKNIELDPLIKLGKGEILSEGWKKNSILADTLEAVIGCIFLSVGYDKTKEIILPFFQKYILDTLESVNNKDYKSQLQEMLQKEGKTTPEYKVISQTGPDHDKSFIVEVYSNNKLLGKGEGKNKKQASQKAAEMAIGRLQKQDW